MTSSQPRLPRIEVKTDEEKAAEAEWRRRVAFDKACRARVDARNADPATASPYDMLADSLMDTIGDGVFAAIIGPDFADALRQRGLVLAPLVEESAVPGAPDEWMQTGLDLIGAHGEMKDPLSLLADLWEEAWRAGWSAHAASPDPAPPAPV